MKSVMIIMTIAVCVAQKKGKMKCCNSTLMDQFCNSQVLIFAKVLNSSKFDNNSIVHRYKVNESYVLKDKTGRVPDVSGIAFILVDNTPCSRPLKTDYYLIGGKLYGNDSIFLDDCGFFMSDRMIDRSVRRQHFLKKIAKDENVCEKKKQKMY